MTDTTKARELTVAEVDAIKFAAVPGCQGYRAGDDGSVWSRWRQRGLGPGRGTELYEGDDWRELRQVPGNHGYMTVCLRGRCLTVHRIVLLAFIGPCPAGMECRHLDGDKLNNRLANLTWGTHAENDADKRRHGTMAAVRGERNGNTKLSDSQVSEIRAIGGTMSHRKIAAMYGVGNQHIGRILSGRYRAAADAARRTK